MPAAATEPTHLVVPRARRFTVLAEMPLLYSWSLLVLTEWPMFACIRIALSGARIRRRRLQGRTPEELLSAANEALVNGDAGKQKFMQGPSCNRSRIACGSAPWCSRKCTWRSGDPAAAEASLRAGWRTATSAAPSSCLCCKRCRHGQAQ